LVGSGGWQPCDFLAYHVFYSRQRLSLVKYLYDFLLRLLDLCYITLSLSLLSYRWAGSSTASGAWGDGGITDFGLDTLRFRRSAIGLGVETLILDRKYGFCGMLDRPSTCPSN